MCGICGFIGFDDKVLLKRMLNKLKHRGPDGEGIFIDKNISLGNRRLAIIDIKGGKQPMYSEDNSVVVVFNGEIYNYKGLKSKLEKKGHQFKTASDTEVLVHLYEEHGDDFVKYLDGMFAIALYDMNKKRLLLARDPLGIKPLYYYYDGDKLLFASEIKALLEYDGIERKVDLNSINDCLVFRFVPDSKTAIKNVEKLLPSHILSFSKNSIKNRRYWNVEIIKNGIENPIKKCYENLEEAVKKRMVSDVPLGVFLSGGLDSSSVVALMSELTNDPIKTFTVGFGENGDEIDHAKLVSDHLGTEHREYIVSIEETIKNIEKIIYHTDDLVLDPAMIPTFFISKLARKHVKVALVGEGADELFGGYLSYKITSPYLKLIPNKVKERIYSKKSIVFKQNEVISLTKYEKFSKISISSEKGISLLNRILKFDIENVLPNYQLMRVDNMTMANSLEARVPFLDRKLVEFSMKIDDNMKLSGFEGKIILKKAISKLLPKKTVEQRKRIFFVPMNKIFNEFGDIYDGVLKESEIFDYGFVKRKIFGNPYKTWFIASIQLWCDKLEVSL